MLAKIYKTDNKRPPDVAQVVLGFNFWGP